MSTTSSPAKHAARRRRRPSHSAGLFAATFLALSTVLGVASCSALGTDDVPAYVREIEAKNRHLEQQFRAGNLLDVADVYADDAVLLDARGARTAGREEIDAYWSAIENPLDWRLEIKRIRGSEVIAYETGTSYLKTLREGVEHTAVSHFLLLWRREPGGDWRIEMDAYWPAEMR